MAIYAISSPMLAANDPFTSGQRATEQACIPRPVQNKANFTPQNQPDGASLFIYSNSPAGG